MNNKQYKTIHNKIDAQIREWKSLLWLGMWTININYITKIDQIKKYFPKKSDGSIVLARTYSSWQYMTADIDINVPQWENLSDDEIRDYVVHELCHVLLDEMHNCDKDPMHEERVATMLQTAFVWTYDNKNSKTSAVVN
jgi:predicted SprT family Zn-dependent metalloprotease